MKFNEITESTTSGSVATVSAPIGGTQSRGQGVYPQKKVGNLLTGKKVKGKFVNSLSESENFKKGDQVKWKGEHETMTGTIYKLAQGQAYITPDSSMRNQRKQLVPISALRKVKKDVEKIDEAELAEHDLILVPGQGHRLKSGFIPHGKSRLDQEVEMAKSDLYQAAKNAKSVYELIKDRTEDEGLEGWVQEKIIKANDYLNSVREYLEGKQIHEMTGGVIAGGGVGESADFGSYYYEKVAKQVFDQNPNLQSEEAVLVRAFDIVTKDLGMNPTRKLFYYDEDFPSDLVSAYSFLKKQTVAEGGKKPYPKTWHDVDPRLGELIGKMSPEEKVKAGLAHPSILKKKKTQGVAEGSTFGNKCAGPFASEERANREASRISKELGVKRYVEKTADGKFIVVKKKGVEEGAKVDRMVKHIAKSEREAGKSKDEAESIAWATANKRGYLDNKNKKKGK